MSGVINYQFRLNGVLIFKIELLIYYYVWCTNQCSILYKVILAVLRATNIEAGGKSAYYFMQVGEAQHSEIGFLISTDDASWKRATNTLKLDSLFLQMMQVGETATTQELVKVSL